MDVLRQNDDQPGRGVLEVNNVYTAMALAREGVGVALANPLLLLGAEAAGLIGRLFEPSIFVDARHSARAAARAYAGNSGADHAGASRRVAGREAPDRLGMDAQAF